MKAVAVRHIERALPEHIKRLEGFGVATVHEAQARSGLMNPRIRPIYSGARIAGSAITALCAPGDNFMLHVGIELVQPGDVLVVAMVSESTDGFIGDILATSLAARGARGVVIDGGVRDVADLKQMGFPVWSHSISAQGTVKETVGAANVPVVCAGVRVVPGDIVVADDDGVVIVPRRDAGVVIGHAQARHDKEILMREEMSRGVLSLDLLSLRSKLEERGLRYVDGPIDWGRSDPDSEL